MTDLDYSKMTIEQLQERYCDLIVHLAELMQLADMSPGDQSLREQIKDTNIQIVKVQWEAGFRRAGEIHSN